MFSIGLMSGTSMDGVEAALLSTDGDAAIKELGHLPIYYDNDFKILLHAAQYCIQKCRGNMAQAKKKYAQWGIHHYLRDALGLHPKDVERRKVELAAYLYGSEQQGQSISLDDVIQRSTRLHAHAVQKLLAKTGFSKDQIDVVGYHGQAMYHQPDERISIIVGDGQLLADLIGISVVNDFRSHDIACGGQGAPFAPLYHQALARRDDMIPAAVVNCGGIANITFINNSNPDDLIGFDSGPGNGLIDRLVRQRTLGQENMDRDGLYGSRGSVSSQAFAALYAKSIVKNGQSYYEMKPPKALDFGDLHLVEELEGLSLEDACATLEAFTADTLVNSLKHVGSNNIPKTWILAGGGWNNPIIRRELEYRLKKKLGEDTRVMTADEAGWNSQALEAQIIAYFAVRSLQGKPLSVPGTTRVPRPVSGGKFYSPKSMASSGAGTMAATSSANAWK